MTLSIAELDGLPSARAADALRTCCGSKEWIAEMLSLRPFGNRGTLLRRADEVWARLGPTDWLEAFTHHPRIGERRAAAPVAAAAQAWSAAEQAATRTATPEVGAALVRANRSYEDRFGFIFIVCATGLSADAILARLEQRLQNERDVELRIAAEEQRRITRLRLEKLVPPTTADAEATS